jgi:hypothetical protein
MGFGFFGASCPLAWWLRARESALSDRLSPGICPVGKSLIHLWELLMVRSCVHAATRLPPLAEILCQAGVSDDSNYLRDL